MHKCYYGIVAVMPLPNPFWRSYPFLHLLWAIRKFREEFVYPFRMFCAEEEASLSSHRVSMQMRIIFFFYYFSFALIVILLFVRLFFSFRKDHLGRKKSWAVGIFFFFLIHRLCTKSFFNDSNKKLFLSSFDGWFFFAEGIVSSCIIFFVHNFLKECLRVTI